jgi:hypothetical protein
VGARRLARLSWGALGAFFSALAGFYGLGGAVAFGCSAHSPRENRSGGVLLMRENEAPSKRRLRGVEVRERARGGEHRYAYRVRYLNAQGQRKARTFDTPQDAMDFRGRLRLLKRAGDLAALDLGRDSLEQFSLDYWRLYAEVRLASRTQETYRSLWNRHVRQRLGGMQLRQITRWPSLCSSQSSRMPGSACTLSAPV